MFIVIGPYSYTSTRYGHGSINSSFHLLRHLHLCGISSLYHDTTYKLKLFVEILTFIRIVGNPKFSLQLSEIKVACEPKSIRALALNICPRWQIPTKIRPYVAAKQFCTSLPSLATRPKLVASKTPSPQEDPNTSRCSKVWCRKSQIEQSKCYLHSFSLWPTSKQSVHRLFCFTIKIFTQYERFCDRFKTLSKRTFKLTAPNQL